MTTKTKKINFNLLETATHYTAKYQKKSELPQGGPFPILKEYREWRSVVSALFEGVYITKEGYKKDSPIKGVTYRAKNEISTIALLKQFGIKKSDTSLEWGISHRVIYMSHCSKWGAYSPNSYIVITSIRTLYVDGVKITIESEGYVEKVNYGSKIILENSKLWQEKTSKYKEATVTVGSIVWKGKQYETRGVMKMGGCTYHFEGKPDNAIYNQLCQKVALKRDKDKKDRENRKNFGGVITLKKLHTSFGWCEFGMQEFCLAIGLDAKEKNSIRTKELLKIWKETDKPTRKALKTEYAEEIAQLLRYCRAN